MHDTPLIETEIECRNQDTQQVAVIALQRLALEVTMHEGLVSEKLTRNVTHVVAYAEQDSPMLFPAILQRFVLCTWALMNGSQFRISDTHCDNYNLDSTPVDDNCYE